MLCRGVRGATTADANTSDDIVKATIQMLALMIRLNDIKQEDVASAIFSTTYDLNAEFPAKAARLLGWLEVPLLCSHEMQVPHALGKCIRVLINWNTDKSQSEITHVYIKDAASLRPDLSDLPPVDYAEIERWIAEQMSSFQKPT